MIIFRLQTDVPVLLVETLHCRAVFHKGNNDLAVFTGIVLLHDYAVSVQDAAVHHGISLYGQHEYLLVGQHIHRNREVVGHVLLGQQGDACGHSADQRHLRNLTLIVCLKLLGQNLQSTGMGGILLDQSHGLQIIDITEYTGGGFQSHRLTDITNRGRIIALQHALPDILKNGLLLRCHIVRIRIFLTSSHSYYLLSFSTIVPYIPKTIVLSILRIYHSTDRKASVFRTLVRTEVLLSLVPVLSLQSPL